MENMNIATVGAENLEGQKLKFDLQFFAEDNPEETKNDPAKESKENEDKKEDNVTYTQEEFDKKLISETDKRVTQALETAKAKWQVEYEKKLESEKSEALKMAKMTAEERAKAEFEKQKNKFEDERKAFEKERLELQTRKSLTEQGLDENFAPFLMGENAESTLDNIKTFKGSFVKSVEKAVKEQLKGSAPESGGEAKPSDVWQDLGNNYKNFNNR